MQWQKSTSGKGLTWLKFQVTVLGGGDVKAGTESFTPTVRSGRRKHMNPHFLLATV